MKLFALLLLIGSTLYCAVPFQFVDNKLHSALNPAFIQKFIQEF